MERFNREQLIKILNELNLPNGEYYILGGSALVFYGIREYTGDLDLCVSLQLFENLKKRMNIDLSLKNNYGFYPISENVEFIPNSKENFKCQKINGYMLENLNQILNFKKARLKEKDLRDIEAIEKYLEKIK